MNKWKRGQTNFDDVHKTLLKTVYAKEAEKQASESTGAVIFRIVTNLKRTFMQEVKYTIQHLWIKTMTTFF